MRYLPIAIVTAYTVAGACAVAQQPVNPQPTAPAPFTNPAIPATLTCGELLPMLHSQDRRPGGVAMLWLDGYYSARAGLIEMPDGWARTVSLGIGETCAKSANASRTVLDVIGELHRAYNATPAPKP
jgi:hypothetical protein